jgi:hypothetical protein
MRSMQILTNPLRDKFYFRPRSFGTHSDVAEPIDAFTRSTQFDEVDIKGTRLFNNVILYDFA